MKSKWSNIEDKPSVKKDTWFLCAILHRNITSYSICKYYVECESWYIPDYLPSIYTVSHYQDLPKLPTREI